MYCYRSHDTPCLHGNSVKNQCRNEHRNFIYSQKFNNLIGVWCDHFRIFEKIRQYFGAQSESIPMSFVLGFYVSLIVKRWWDQYKLLPWPDTLALFISAAIPGNVSLIAFVLFYFYFCFAFISLYCFVLQFYFNACFILIQRLTMIDQLMISEWNWPVNET